MEFVEYITLINNDHRLCSEYQKKLSSARSKKQIFELMADSNGMPLYEYTLCGRHYVRVNLLLVRRGVLSVQALTSAVLRSAENMPTVDSKYVVSHSTAFKQAYDPHYRIVRRDIFESEILPLLDE